MKSIALLALCAASVAAQANFSFILAKSFYGNKDCSRDSFIGAEFYGLPTDTREQRSSLPSFSTKRRRLALTVPFSSSFFPFFSFLLSSFFFLRAASLPELHPLGTHQHLHRRARRAHPVRGYQQRAHRHPYHRHQGRVPRHQRAAR
jgi:hypothetical protein